MNVTHEFIPMKRAVNQELFYFILGDCYKQIVDGAIDNETFMMRDYSWDEELRDNDYHLYHKPSGLKVRWYKYPLRSPEVNMPISHDQWRAVLYDCLNAVRGSVAYPIQRWWEHGCN